MPISGTIQLDLPPFSDVNSNGFNDFFESALGVGATTSRNYTTVLGNGTVTATWQREAGSPTGGHLQDLQQALSLPSTNWQTVVSVTLTNDPQLVSVPYLPVPAAFWRALAH